MSVDFGVLFAFLEVFEELQLATKIHKAFNNRKQRMCLE
jgi:hypothetical protein